MLKPYVLPNDWETWDTLPSDEFSDDSFTLPVEHVHYNYRTDVMAFKHPLDGEVWINTAERFRDDDGKWHDGVWVKYSEMKGDQHEAITEIAVCLDEIREGLRRAVTLAKAAGVRLYLDKEFHLVNVEPDGSTWINSSAQC